MKLCIELVPGSAWFKNLRNLVGRTEWDKIRVGVYKKYNYKCAICSSDGRISCHEIWEYDDENHIQKLVGYLALCDNCHNIKHIGLSKIRAEHGELDFKLLINHFMSINECSFEEFLEHREKAFEKWNDRSKFEWKLDLSNFIKVNEQEKLL